MKEWYFLAVIIILMSALVGFLVEIYKKFIRKNRYTDLEARLVAMGLSIACSVPVHFIFDLKNVIPAYSGNWWIILAYGLAIYLVQMPICMKVAKKAVSAILKKRGIEVNLDEQP